MSALRGPVLEALPIVADFERELERLPPADRDRLIADADAFAAHRFDLLGSGEVDLGPEIDWQLDFKSGRSWPLNHVFRIPKTFSDGSDPHVPRELSRFHHLPVMAAATRITGDPHYREVIGRQLEHWIDANPVEFGVGWLVTMDAGIRAANWIAALALCGEDLNREPWLDRALESLLLHGRFIRRHHERGTSRNNKYLCDIVGVLAIAALFPGGREGRAWLTWAAQELPREMAFQVHPDGSTFEASTSYHRLSAEVFGCGIQALDALGRPVPDWCRERLDRMLDFVADYTRPDGLAASVGDGADSRFLPLRDYPRVDPRSHVGLFQRVGREYRPTRGHAAYPGGGHYVMRGGGLYAMVRCGDLGSAGYGWHAHNDQLSFELALGAQPLVIDPGTYVYTGDPQARNMFRSTPFHSTLQVGGEEQNELDDAEMFVLPDRSRAEALGFEARDGRASFEGRHHGFESLSPPAVHSRRIEFDGPAGTLTIIDTVSCPGAHPLQWTFPLAPCDARVDGGRAIAEFEGAVLTIQGKDLGLSVEQGWYSPRYGVRHSTPFIRARRQGRPGEDTTILVLSAEPR